jgi:hypothetical protein
MASQEKEEECIRSVGMRTSEERVARWLPPVKVEVWCGVFPDASHSYCSYALLPFPFGLHGYLSSREN